MTPFIKKKEVQKDWYIIDAQNAAVGRLAAYISKVIRGKNKATYNPHIDNGDFVVVTNIDKIKFTGKKDSHFEMLKKLELTDSEFIKIKLYCKKKKIIFISTPYDSKSANFLNSINTRIFKIASADISDYLL